MNKQTTKVIPLLAAGLAPTAAVTSALFSPLALSAPGDLDPAFGDLGRLGPILNGPAWSLEALEDGTMLLGGGDMQFFYYGWYYYYEPVTTNFVSLLSDTGSTDPGFTAATLDDIQVFDVIRQPDAQVVAVGRKVGTPGATSQLTVFRLQSDGSLDTTFASSGIFELPMAEHGDRQVATSIVLDADGRVVVAGSRGDQVIVLRLLPDGSLDDSFGTSGVFAGPDTYDFSADGSNARTRILRTIAGGYRVTASNSAGCQVFALTAVGAMDDAFGTSGTATVDAPSGPSTSCNSLASQADGRLVVAGSAAGQGFAARLLADGQPDPDFSAIAVSDAMSDATAVAVGDDGSTVVAGRGVSGASIMRLQMNGELDALFGNGGSTLIDLPSVSGTSPVVRDLIVRADGSVVAAGGDDFSRGAFVVRLLDAGGGDSPGVLGVSEQSAIPTSEGTDEAVVNVRRTGGAFGTVSVAYETLAGDAHTAEVEQDFAGVSGRLTWADGDTTEQQIHVAILTDDSVEEPERFGVMLSDAQGGASLGTFNATFEIAADGSPSGQLGFSDITYPVGESQTVEVTVLRNYYFTGPVSVTLTPIGDTATAGDDFVADSVTVSWAHDDSDSKLVELTIVDDTAAEPVESFTVELSNPTGGAVIGAQSSATVNIHASDQPPPERASGGGGALGYLSLLLLGATGFMRSARLLRRGHMPRLAIGRFKTFQHGDRIVPRRGHAPVRVDGPA
jgi:uncharacterized delta-60 repeat protein